VLCAILQSVSMWGAILQSRMELGKSVRVRNCCAGINVTLTSIRIYFSCGKQALLVSNFDFLAVDKLAEFVQQETLMVMFCLYEAVQLSLQLVDCFCLHGKLCF
jgi:hypothetical protein